MDDRTFPLPLRPRLLQLFCEGHCAPLQHYVRQQTDNHHSYNMVTEVVVFMKEVPGGHARPPSPRVGYNLIR